MSVPSELKTLLLGTFFKVPNDFFVLFLFVSVTPVVFVLFRSFRCHIDRCLILFPTIIFLFLVFLYILYLLKFLLLIILLRLLSKYF